MALRLDFRKGRFLFLVFWVFNGFHELYFGQGVDKGLIQVESLVD